MAHILILLVILAPGFLAGLYYMNITDRKKIPPLEAIGLFAAFAFLCNLLPMLITWLKWSGEPLSILGYGGVFNQLQFLVKYMLLQCVSAVLLPWAAAFLSMFSAERVFDKLIDLMAAQFAEKSRERKARRALEKAEREAAVKALEESEKQAEEKEAPRETEPSMTEEETANEKAD
ncbi:MAG: hypothetical protein LBS62_09680 [Clostridiales bacterium]|jgi:maltodextrin utilization protein YvdJ|nr:hypothetical protein [Clostridiales bacterium]